VAASMKDGTLVTLWLGFLIHHSQAKDVVSAGQPLSSADLGLLPAQLPHSLLLQTP
jgi:hypothetical protein